MAQNPYAGTYRPVGLSMTKADIVRGLKGIKIKAPNRKMSSQSYKSALPKENEGGGNS
jgi:hypothetical protein